MPTPVFLLGVLAPVATAVIRVSLPASLGPYADLVWLLGLIPVFLLPRHLGWRGALYGLLWTALFVALAGVTVAVLHGELVDWKRIGSVTTVVAAVALGVGLNQQWWGAGAPRSAGEPASAPEDAVADGMPTRAAIGYFLDRLFAAARRDHALALVLVELDDRDQLVDEFGTSAIEKGSEVLRRALESAARAMDVVGRWSEATYVVLLQAETLEGAFRFGRRVVEAAESLEAPWGGHIQVNIGISAYHPGVERAEALVAEATRAMDTARSMGGNAIVVYHGRSDEALVESGMVVLEPDGRVREIRRTVV